MKELVRRSCTDRAPSALRERIAVQCRTVSVTRTEARRHGPGDDHLDHHSPTYPAP